MGAQRITDGPDPKHAQLSALLSGLVGTELEPGSAIPSERELMARYDVSRATVRKAVDALVADGVLHRVHGKGTFVTTPRLETRLHLASFSQDMRRRGLTPSTRLLGVAHEQPPPDVAEVLGVGKRGAWRVDRVRLADGEPIAIEQGWYSRHLLPDLDRQDLGGSLYELLADRYGVVIDAAEQTLWGESADAATARRLDAPVHTPLLVFRRVASAAGRPIEYVVSRYRGDRYQVHMALGSQSTGSQPSDTTGTAGTPVPAEGKHP